MRWRRRGAGRDEAGGSADRTLSAVELEEKHCLASGGDAARLAEIRVRKGAAQFLGGRGASAVLTLDEALRAYFHLDAHVPSSPHALDYGAAFALNADVLLCHGDPDLAVASADGAVRQYLTNREAANAEPQRHLGVFQRALEVAGHLHAAAGRWELALAADDLAVQSAPRIGDARERARARMAVHLRACGRGVEAAALEDRAGAVLEEERAAFAELPRLTLRTAIAQAREVLAAQDLPPSLDMVLTDPGDRKSAGWAPFLRCPEQMMPGAAGLLARAALKLAERDPQRTEVCRTLALEAHYLFAVASRDRTPGMRYGFADHGPDWARALLWLARTGLADDPVAAEDLTGWLGRVLVQLRPLPVDAGTTALLEECRRFVAGT